MYESRALVSLITISFYTEILYMKTEKSMRYLDSLKWIELSTTYSITNHYWQLN